MRQFGGGPRCCISISQVEGLVDFCVLSIEFRSTVKEQVQQVSCSGQQENSDMDRKFPSLESISRVWGCSRIAGH